MRNQLFPDSRAHSRLLLVLIAKVVHFQARQARVDEQEGGDLQIPPNHGGVQGRPVKKNQSGERPDYSRAEQKTMPLQETPGFSLITVKNRTLQQGVVKDVQRLSCCSLGLGHSELVETYTAIVGGVYA